MYSTFRFYFAKATAAHLDNAMNGILGEKAFIKSGQIVKKEKKEESLANFLAKTLAKSGILIARPGSSLQCIRPKIQ